MTFFVALSYAVFALLEEESIVMLSKDDGLFETIGAIGLFVGSAICLTLYVKNRESNDFFFLRTRKNLFFLLLAIILFFGGAEEISWGQRIFGFATPRSMAEINYQHECNVHNMAIFYANNGFQRQRTGWGKLLTMEFQFTLFWFVFCVLVPILSKLSTRWDQFRARINLPIVPLWLSALFVLNYFLSKSVELQSGERLERAIIEIKECNFELLFFVVSFHFLWLTVRQAPSRKKDDFKLVLSARRNVNSAPISKAESYHH